MKTHLFFVDPQEEYSVMDDELHILRKFDA
jgi:hypothetical protein